jgi:tRNA(adenine34) deaminase
LHPDIDIIKIRNLKIEYGGNTILSENRVNFVLKLPGLMENSDDSRFMSSALAEARSGLSKDEVPIGAVIVANGIVIARAHNLTETLKDATAHAEILAITSAEAYLGSKYLTGCTLYVTVEPCPMCAGAIHWSQIERVVYGCADPKRGYSLFSPDLLQGTAVATLPSMEEECSSIIVNFFKDKR